MGQSKQRSSASASGGHTRGKSHQNVSSASVDGGQSTRGKDDSVSSSSSSFPPNLVTGGMLSSKLMLTFHLVLAVICGVLYRNHVFTLKENEVHFSHLSDMEREMSFRTEIGFYYCRCRNGCT